MIYTEIFRLKTMLEKAKIPFDFTDRGSCDWAHYHIEVPKMGERRIVSVIQGSRSYGGDENLLEIMGLLTEEERKDDSVCGHLTAEDVFERIKIAYK